MRTFGWAFFFLSLFLSNNLLAQEKDKYLKFELEILDSDPTKLPKFMLGLDLGYWTQLMNSRNFYIAPDLRIHSAYIFNKNYKLDLKVCLLTDPDLGPFNRFNEFHATAYRTLFSGQRNSKRRIKIGTQFRLFKRPIDYFKEIKLKKLRTVELNIGFSHFQIANANLPEENSWPFLYGEELKDAVYSNVKLGLSFFSNYYVKYRLNHQLKKTNLNYRIYGYLSYAYNATANNLFENKLEINGIQEGPNLSGVPNFGLKPFGWRIGGERNWSNFSSTVVTSLNVEYGSLPYLEVQEFKDVLSTTNRCFMLGIGLRFGRLPD